VETSLEHADERDLIETFDGRLWNIGSVTRL